MKTVISASAQRGSAATASATQAKACRPLPPSCPPRCLPLPLCLLRPRATVQRANEAWRRGHPSAWRRDPCHGNIWGGRLHHLLVSILFLFDIDISIHFDYQRISVEVDERQEKIQKGTCEVFQALHHSNLQMLEQEFQEQALQEQVFKEQEFQENKKRDV